MKKWSREQKILSIIVTFLVIVVAVTAVLQARSSQPLFDLYQDEILVVAADNEPLMSLSRQDLEKIPNQTFAADRRTSAGDHRQHEYTGILLKDLLSLAKLDPADYAQATVRAVDGYVAALDQDQILADDEVYLVWLQDGKPLQSRDEGGDGPYLILIRHEAFSQNWVKYAVEVHLS